MAEGKLKPEAKQWQRAEAVSSCNKHYGYRYTSFSLNFNSNNNNRSPFSLQQFGDFVCRTASRERGPSYL